MFPLGKAALAMLAILVASGIALLAMPQQQAEQKYDLVLAGFAAEHIAAYREVIPRFEQENNCKIQLQLVDQRALQDRLQSSLEVGAEVPDMVELLYGTFGIFTMGRVEDVKLVDLTDRIHQEKLMDRVVANRFPRWSSRGRIFALPHDVHPVMMVYRRDLCEQLGIDVSTLTTWDKFCEVGRRLKDMKLPGDTFGRRYMIDLDYAGNDALKLLLFQRGGGMFNEQGEVIFDSPEAVDTVVWYVKQTHGENPVGYGCGSGSNFSRAMMDGLALFYLCPDWRAKQIMNDVPNLAGKLAVMPLPAWEEGGSRTSTWGGTGLAITKQCKNPELAWKLAMYLYYDASQVGPRYAKTFILPPLRDAWAAPAIRDTPVPFYSEQKIGAEFAALADGVPRDFDTSYGAQANGKLSEAYTNAADYYDRHGENGLREFTAAELKRRADQVRHLMDRNVFLKTPLAAAADQKAVN